MISDPRKLELLIDSLDQVLWACIHDYIDYPEETVKEYKALSEELKSILAKSSATI